MRSFITNLSSSLLHRLWNQSQNRGYTMFHHFTLFFFFTFPSFGDSRRAASTCTLNAFVTSCFGCFLVKALKMSLCLPSSFFEGTPTVVDVRSSQYNHEGNRFSWTCAAPQKYNQPLSIQRFPRFVPFREPKGAWTIFTRVRGQKSRQVCLIGHENGHYSFWLTLNFSSWKTGLQSKKIKRL